jgi:hypothetical protein
VLTKVTSKPAGIVAEPALANNIIVGSNNKSDKQLKMKKKGKKILPAK